MSDLLAAWRDRVREATSAGTPLRIVGGGTMDFYGQRLAGEIFEVAGHTGIVDYDPTELVITARCGTPLAEIEQTMAKSGQMLAFEPPRFGPKATLGGSVAAGLSGPRRPYAGAVRDLVLGLRLLDGRGDELAFGGRVMKNVAGFDVSRLVAGSLGTLGVILEVSLKCLPLPRAETTLTFELAADEALRRLNGWNVAPLPLSGSCWHDGRLHVRLSGAESAVTAAARRLGGEPLEDAARYWAAVRNQTHDFFAPFRDNPRPSRFPMARRRYGGFRCARLRRSPVSAARRWSNGAARCAGWPRRANRMRNTRADGRRRTAATRRCSAARTSPPACSIRCLRRCWRCISVLKAALDPAGIFNPGRMYAELLSGSASRRFHPGHARWPRCRVDSASLRALRLLHGHLSDLPVAGRRARRTARPDLPDQADARG